MSLLVVTSFEFLQFLKIVMWITIPLIIISMLMVTFWHYRRKKKEALVDDPEQDFPLAKTSNIEPLVESSLDGEREKYWAEDYRQELKRNKEEYALLDNEFRQLKKKYSALLLGENINPDNLNLQGGNESETIIGQYELKIAQMQQTIEFMESNNISDEERVASQKLLGEKEQQLIQLQSIVEQLQKELYLLDQQKDSQTNEIQKLYNQLKEMQELARLASNDAREYHGSFQQQMEGRDKQHFEERNRLNEQLRELNEAYKRIGEENLQLQEKIHGNRLESGYYEEAYKNQIEELQAALAKANEETTALKNNLTDGAYLQDLLSEKKLQIEFLQNQLDQRIRNNHETEQRSRESDKLSASLQDEIGQFRQQQTLWQEELQQKNQEIQSLNDRLTEKNNEGEQWQQAVDSKQQHIASLEASLKDLQVQKDYLNQEINNDTNRISSLEQELHNIQEHVQLLENNLQNKHQILSKLHQELVQALDIQNSENNANGFSVESDQHELLEVYNH